MSLEMMETTRTELGKLVYEVKSVMDQWTTENPATREDEERVERLFTVIDEKKAYLDTMERQEGLRTKGSKLSDYMSQSTGRPSFATSDARNGLGGFDNKGIDDEDDDDDRARKVWEVKSDADRVQNRYARKALIKVLRYGDNSPVLSLKLNDMEKKALSESVDSEGGYAVPVDFQSELIKRLPEFTFVRGASAVRTTLRDRVIVPRIANSTADPDIFPTGAVITWGGEIQGAAETDIAFENVDFLIHKMRALVKISRDLLDDAAVNIEQEVMEALAASIALEEERVFIAGSGVLRPLGIVNDPGVTGVTSAAVGVVGADDLFDVQNAMPTQYANNAVWVMRRDTWAASRKLKDGMGNYLWQPGLERGAPPTLLGAPVVLCPFMPATATGVKPILYGDFRYFRIWDRPGMSLQRLNELYSANDQIGVIVRRRLGAGVTLPNAFKLLTIA